MADSGGNQLKIAGGLCMAGSVLCFIRSGATQTVGAETFGKMALILLVVGVGAFFVSSRSS